MTSLPPLASSRFCLCPIVKPSVRPSVRLVSTGSGSAGSHCSDQQGEAAGSQSEPSKREAGAAGEQQQQQQLMEEELPGEDGAPRRPSGPPTDLHPQVDPQDDIPAASSLSRSQRRDLAAARQSFRLAVGNPGDFFVDVM